MLAWGVLRVTRPQDTHRKNGKFSLIATAWFQAHHILLIYSSLCCP